MGFSPNVQVYPVLWWLGKLKPDLSPLKYRLFLRYLTRHVYLLLIIFSTIACVSILRPYTIQNRKECVKGKMVFSPDMV
jgi:hypothetical protein